MSFSFCLPPRPSTSFASFAGPLIGTPSGPRSGVTPRFFPRTLMPPSHRPGRGHLSAFGCCYLRNFWRAVARYFLSAQSQAAHCCWFLAVSGCCCCCFLPPPFRWGHNHQRESARSVRAAGVTGRRRRDRRSRPCAAALRSVAARREGADG